MMPTRDEALEELWRRRQARARLLRFVEYTYDDWQSGEHHAKICDALEAVERGEIKRLMIWAPPRHSKSELASKRFPAWYLGRHPDKQILTATYNVELATDIGRDVRNLLRSESYRRVFPEVDIAPDSSAAGRWHTSAGGIYHATGIGGTVTGRGADVALIDDPIKNREEADSARIRESVWRWYSSTFYTRLMPDGKIVLMVTRWHEDDLAARCLESEDWTVVHLPAIANEGTEKEAALWPEWYDLETMRHTRDVISLRDWSSLYQGNPRPETGTYFQREWVRWHTEAPKVVSVYMASDFAATRQDDATDPDHTEHGVFGVGTDDTVYVLDWWHGQTGPDQWVEALLDLQEKWKPIRWFAESGVIRRAVEPFLRKRRQERRVYCAEEWIASIADKQARGRSFQARASLGKVSFPRTDWGERVVEQCVAFPSARHDDAFDAMSLMCLAIDGMTAARDRPEPIRLDRWAKLGKKTKADAKGWKVI
jgi:predicted phage terminase large subunit-like protein